MSDLLVQLQEEHREWEQQHFPMQTVELSLLGMCEEYGEYLVAVGEPELLDAIADCVIFACSVCEHMGWSLQLVWMLDAPWPADASWPVQLGKICHHYQKLKQGIRGTELEHLAGMQRALNVLLRYLAQEVEELTGSKPAFLNLVWDTWQSVKARDWSAHREQVGECVHEWIGSTNECRKCGGPETDKRKEANGVCPWCNKPILETLSHGRGRCDATIGKLLGS